MYVRGLRDQFQFFFSPETHLAKILRELHLYVGGLGTDSDPLVDPDLQ